MDGTSSLGILRCSITVMSGSVRIPPLKAAIGVVRPRGSTSMPMPRGGRPLVIAKRIPALPSSLTAWIASSVSTFSLVTRVPSTSASKSRIDGVLSVESAIH